MADPSRPSVIYSLDADNAIMSVNAAWVEFAAGNSAPELSRDFVVGRPVWDFIAGEQTRQLYESIFDNVRRRKGPVSIPFRCDSPDRFRFMQLKITNLAGGGLECEAVLIREQERPFFSILDQAFPRSDSSLPICSFCKRLLVFGVKWMEVEDAVVRLRLLDDARVPRLEQRVCDRCASIVRDAAVCHALQ